MALAPIVLFTYNRIWHVKQTLDALIQNNLSRQSDLIVFSDGPKSQDDINNIHIIRDYLKTINGFNSILVVEREANLGLSASIITGVTDVINKFGRIIVLEDDMVTSPYFLQFMNSALDVYENEDEVISVHGYVYPIKAQLPDTFFLKDTGCWGWGTWKRGWDQFESDGNKLYNELVDQKLTQKFDCNGSFDFTRILQDQVEGKNNSWAIRWQASAFLNNRLTLFPGQSMLKNIGHDGSGVHCGVTNCFEIKLANKPLNVSKIQIEENVFVLKELEKYFRSIKPDLRSKIAGIINSVISNLKLKIGLNRC